MEKTEISLLVQKAINKDNHAFNSLYNEYGKTVYFTALKLTGNKQEAEDILQDTFISALEKLNTLKNPEEFGSWIVRIAVNKCKSHFRKQKPIAEDNSTIAEMEDENSIIPDDFVDNEQKRKIIMDIIDSVLTDEQRQTVILFYYDNLRAAEIAEIMDCSVGTVTSRLSCARAKIKEAILIYEKQNNDKLHILVPIPILTKILNAEAEKLTLPKIANISNAQSNTDTPQNSAVPTGKKTILATTQSKIIAGIVSVVLIGGTITAIILGRNSDDNNVKTNTPPSSNYSIDNSYYKEESDYNNTTDNESKEKTSEKKDYPQFDGLKTVELKKIGADYFESDEDSISGKIKDVAFKDDYTIILDQDSNLYVYCYMGYGKGYETYLVGENTGLQSLDFVHFEHNSNFDLTIVSGNTAYYKIVKYNDQYDVSDKYNCTVMNDKTTGMPIDHTGALINGREIKYASFSGKTLSIIDADGKFYSGSNYHLDPYDEWSNRADDIYLDDKKIFEQDDEERENIAQVANSHYMLNTDGVLLNSRHSLDESDTVESVKNIKFTKIFSPDFADSVSAGTSGIDGSVAALNEDGKIYIINSDENIKNNIKLTTDKPEGEVEEIHYTYDKIIVKTDRGYFYLPIEETSNDIFQAKSNSNWKEIEALDNVSDKIVRIYAQSEPYKTSILISNGYLYTIEFDS